MIDALIGNAASREVIMLLAAGESSDLLAIAVYATMAIVVGVGLLFLSEVLGARRRDPEKESVYEFGIRRRGSGSGTRAAPENIPLPVGCPE